MDERWTPVLNELRKRFAADADVVEVEAYLSAKGYDRRQIGEILSLLFRDTSPVAPVRRGWDPAPSAREAAVRVQGPHERGRFTTDAWGYLVRLGGSGAMSRNEFEQLVERALVHVDGRIGLPEIRTMAEEGGFDDPAASGERSQLH
jgi:Smg protein